MFVVTRPAAVHRLAVDDPLRPDDACVADVDHVGVGHVQRHPEADQEHDRDREPRRGHEEMEAFAAARVVLAPARGGAAGWAPHQHQHPHEEVDEGRVHGRHRAVDVRVVEERQGDREREEDEQVEVQQAKGLAEVEERDEEQEAQRQPDVERVDVAAEGAAVAAGHRPGDLEAGPLFDHAAGEVVDDHLRDLLLAAFGEVAHLPAEAGLQVGATVRALVFRAGGLDLRQLLGDREHLVWRQPASGGRRVGGRHGDRRFRVGRRRGGPARVRLRCGADRGRRAGGVGAVGHRRSLGAHERRHEGRGHLRARRGGGHEQADEAGEHRHRASHPPRVRDSPADRAR